jgi:hypothetical protein
MMRSPPSTAAIGTLLAPAASAASLLPADFHSDGAGKGRRHRAGRTPDAGGLYFRTARAKLYGAGTKKRGRPPTGQNPHVGFRSLPSVTRALDAAAEAKALSRSELVRCIVTEWLRKHKFLTR